MTKPAPGARFVDRTEAGRLLAARLVEMSLDNPIVYALPRGGVPVALEVARALSAPLDLVLVRKIGAPGAPELALGAVVGGASPQTVINESVRTGWRVDDAYLDRARAQELKEIDRRRARYLGDRPQSDPRGRSVVVVDDGLATGATMKAALIALRAQGAARICVAVPVAPPDSLAEITPLADDVVCLNPARVFHGVGAFYDDFHQLSDEETVALLQEGWAIPTRSATGPAPDPTSRRTVSVPPRGLSGELAVPPAARGLVLFAHGSGSSRLSPRNAAVADALNARGFATLLFDLLTPDEAADRRNVFDIPLLADRIMGAALYAAGEPDVADLPLGIFGASTGAALVAAGELGSRVAAVVSRGGRPDLAGQWMARVAAPTLLIVGGNDTQVIALNEQALAALPGEKHLLVVPGAGHLFEEPGALETVARAAGDWFHRHLSPCDTETGPAATPAGHPKSSSPGATAATASADADPAGLAATLRRIVQPLSDPDDPGFAAAFDRYGDARVVLLGEATHGTSEFYRARAAITRRLVEQHGFTIVALEADWPDAAVLDRGIAGAAFPPVATMPGARPPPFSRFPTWMWRNREFDTFVASLRRHNAGLDAANRVRLRGLDLYSMSASVAAVLDYLDRVDPEAAGEARARYACLDPWSGELAAYGRASLGRGFALCEAAVSRTLVDLLRQELHYAAQDGDDFFDAAQNARLVTEAERYYRVMYYGAREAWNLRDQHMFDTLARVLDRAGPDAKAVVWAHNSHIGDARFTEMGARRGELNIGQLCREAFGRGAALIGFGTHSGSVAAASEWDAPVEIKTVRPSRADSYEGLCHQVGLPRFLLDMGPDLAPAVREALKHPRLERYIGVIYRPETERWSHYAEATLPDQYDGFVWFDETRAVTPLPTPVRAGEDDTFPFGL